MERVQLQNTQTWSGYDKWRLDPIIRRKFEIKINCNWNQRLLVLVVLLPCREICIIFSVLIGTGFIPQLCRYLSYFPRVSNLDLCLKRSLFFFFWRRQTTKKLAQRHLIKASAFFAAVLPLQTLLSWLLRRISTAKIPENHNRFSKYHAHCCLGQDCIGYKLPLENIWLQFCAFYKQSFKIVSWLLWGSLERNAFMPDSCQIFQVASFLKCCINNNCWRQKRKISYLKLKLDMALENYWLCHLKIWIPNKQNGDDDDAAGPDDHQLPTHLWTQLLVEPFSTGGAITENRGSNKFPAK